MRISVDESRGTAGPKEDETPLTNRGSDTFTWDYEDRMVSATVNSVTSNFTYLGDGLRNSRQVGGGSTTTFTWDIAGGLPVGLWRLWGG